MWCFRTKNSKSSQSIQCSVWKRKCLTNKSVQYVVPWSITNPESEINHIILTLNLNKRKLKKGNTFHINNRLPWFFCLCDNLHKNKIGKKKYSLENTEVPKVFVLHTTHCLTKATVYLLSLIFSCTCTFTILIWGTDTLTD